MVTGKGVPPRTTTLVRHTGQISPDLRWPDPQRTDDPRKVLESEGIRFDEWNRADREQYLSAADLAALMDLDIVPVTDP